MSGESSKYKIGVEITGDDSKFRASAKSSEKAVSDLEKKASGDFKKLASNFAGVFKGKAEDTGLGSFVGDITSGTSALDKFLGPATIASGVIVGIGTAAVASGKMLFDMAKNASDYSGDISDASQKTGLAIDTISSMKFAGDAFGASFEEMTGATTKFTKLVGESAKGNEEAKKTLIALGVDPKAAVNDLDGAMAKAMKTIYNLPPGVQQLNASTDAFGKNLGGRMIPVINSFNGDLNALKKRASELGLVLTDEAIKAGDDFGDTYEIVAAQAKATGAAFALEFAPAITETMDDVSKYLARNKDDWKEWGRAVGDIIRGVKLAAKEAGEFKAVQELQSEGYGRLLFGPLYSLGDIAQPFADAGKASRETEEAQWKNVVRENDGTAVPLTDKPKGKPKGSYFDGLGSGKKDKESKSAQVLANLREEYLIGKNGKADTRISLGEGIKLRESLEKLVSQKAVQLFLETTRQAEGGAPNIFVGGRKVNDLSRHPGEYIPRSEWYNGKNSNPKDDSSASGSYQITLSNYKRLAPMLGISDFSPKSQAILALAIMREQGTKGFEDLVQNNLEGAFKFGTQPWASSSFSTLKGGKKNYIKIAEGIAGTNLDALGGELGITKKELTEGEKAIADLNKQIELLGVNSEKRRAEIETTIGSLSGLTAEEKENYIAAAQRKDSLEAQAKATADYNDHLVKLGEQYDEMNGVEKTATGELEKYIAALVASGKYVDPVIEANARNKALMIDMQSVNVKLGESINNNITSYKAERDAVWDTILAHQELKNAIARETGGREETAGSISDSIDWKPYLADIEAADKVAGKAPKMKDQHGLGDFTDGLLGGRGNNLARFQTEAEAMKAVYNDLENTAGAALGSMIEGGAQLLEQWIMTGEMSGEAIAQMTASIIAGVASQAGVKAIFEVAEGLAALANPFTAWQAPIHFAAAKTYGLVALGAVAVGAGIGAAGGLGGKKDKDSSNDSKQNPSEYFSNNSDDRSMNYLRQSQSGNSQNNRENVQHLSAITDAVNGLTNRINSMPAGNVLTAGVKQNPGFITDTVDRELAKNSTKANSFGRRLGMK